MQLRQLRTHLGKGPPGVRGRQAPLIGKDGLAANSNDPLEILALAAAGGQQRRNRYLLMRLQDLQFQGRSSRGCG